MRAYVLVHVRTGQEREVTRALKGQPGILRADFTFGPYDVIAEVEAMQTLLRRADRVEATDPELAARLRRKAARIGL